MIAGKSPVEKRIALLRDLWIEATDDAAVRVVVWRVPDNASRMLLAFFEAQRHEGDWQSPDLFIQFDAAFETGFSYSRALCEALVESYAASRDGFAEQGIAFDWAHDAVPRAASAAGFLALLQSFAAHHRAHFRCAAAALMPTSTTSAEAFDAWVAAALKAGVPTNVHLVLVDSTGDRHWDRLAQEHAGITRVIGAPIDMFDIARETAAQAASTGPAVAYRQLLTDVLTLVEKGTPAQAGARADKAMKIAERERWFDQQVVLHMAVAGAQLKAGEHPAAIHRYRQARTCAEEAMRQQHPVGGNLVVQTWFGEAGAWLAAKQWRQAAQAYRSGAEAAQRLPNAMFALEGFRMAGFCFLRAGDTEPAHDHLVLAVREGKAMPPGERALTTLTFALNDLLRLRDAPRADELERLARAYQADTATAHSRAEKDAAALGATPAPSAVDRIEAQMHASFETAFRTLREKRERVVAGGDAFFRKVVAVGRDLLHPHWAGVPEVKHPLDKEQAAWDPLPAEAELPAAGELTSPPARAAQAAA